MSVGQYIRFQRLDGVQRLLTLDIILVWTRFVELVHCEGSYQPGWPVEGQGSRCDGAGRDFACTCGD